MKQGKCLLMLPGIETIVEKYIATAVKNMQFYLAGSVKNH
jgi:hypothetical protein